MGALPDPECSQVVLVGTSFFKVGDLPDLPAVEHNLADLTAAFTDPETGIVKRAQCTVVNTPDTQRMLLARLRKAAAEAEDLLLVYYAGHGIRHPRNNRLYLTTWETDPDDLEGTAVPFESVREIFDDNRAQTRLLILDCCYSGLALGAMAGSGLDSNDIKVTGTTVIASSPKNEISHSPPGERNTAFTKELLSLLVDGPRVPGTQLDVSQLFGSVRAAMSRRGLPLPKMQAGDTSTRLILRRPEPRPVEPPAPILPESAPEPVPIARPEPMSRGEQPSFPPRGPVRDVPVAGPAQPSVSVEQPALHSVPMTAGAPPVPSARPPRVRRPADDPARLWFGQLWALLRTSVRSVGLYFFGSYGLGCLLTAMFGFSQPGRFSTDLGAGFGMLAVALPFGFFVWRGFVRARRSVDRERSEAVAQIEARVAKVQDILLWVALGATALFVLLAFLVPAKVVQTTTASVSDSALTWTMCILFVAVAVPRVRRLVHRRS